MSRSDFVIDVPVYPAGIEAAIHARQACHPELCLFHAPSEHPMADWPIVIRMDRIGCLAERLCRHDVGHPDPDSLAYVESLVRRLGVERWGQTPEKADRNAAAQGVHGCDGCCRG
jgi:hypothetical protein